MPITTTRRSIHAPTIPALMVFLAALASAALVAMILVYVFILPSKMVFSRAAGCEG